MTAFICSDNYDREGNARTMTDDKTSGKYKDDAAFAIDRAVDAARTEGYEQGVAAAVQALVKHADDHWAAGELDDVIVAARSASRAVQFVALPDDRETRTQLEQGDATEARARRMFDRVSELWIAQTRQHPSGDLKMLADFICRAVAEG